MTETIFCPRGTHSPDRETQHLARGAPVLLTETKILPEGHPLSRPRDTQSCPRGTCSPDRDNILPEGHPLSRPRDAASRPRGTCSPDRDKDFARGALTLPTERHAVLPERAPVILTETKLCPRGTHSPDRETQHLARGAPVLLTETIFCPRGTHSPDREIHNHARGAPNPDREDDPHTMLVSGFKRAEAAVEDNNTPTHWF